MQQHFLGVRLEIAAQNPESTLDVVKAITDSKEVYSPHLADFVCHKT